MRDTIHLRRAARRAFWPALAALGVAGLLGLSVEARSAVAQPKPVDPHATVEADAYRDRTSGVDAATAAAGEQVYQQVCSACHETGANRAPSRFIVSQMTPDSIHEALVNGVMKPMASGLTEAQKVAVAEFLTKRRLGEGAAKPPLMCTGPAARFDRNAPPELQGWGLEPAGTHTLPTAVAGVDRANVGRLKLKWAVAFPNALRARSAAGIAGGAVFVGSHDGTVYALDQASGCARWTFKARGEVRTGILVSPWRAGDAAAKPLAYFGDILGNLYAVDAFTGKQVWTKTMDPHPSTTLTATPLLYEGRLYVSVSSLEEGAASDPKYPCCTFRGSLAALDPATGAEIWRTYFTPPAKPTTNGRFGPSGTAIWNTPVVDAKRRQLYLATGDNYSSPATPMSDAIVALDLATGQVKWAYQARPADAWNGGCSGADKANCPEENGPDFDFGAGVVLAKAADGRDVVVGGQKSGIAYGVDPDTGKLVWRNRIGRGGVVGGIEFALAASGGLVYIPVSDVPDGRTYDIAPQPGLYALDVATGKVVWSARTPSEAICAGKPLCHPGYSGTLAVTPELVLAGSNDGWFRVFDAKTGSVLWETDTNGEVKTVNGTIAHGGSVAGGSGPLPYHGRVFVPSGYGFAGKMPGNVLLAYGVD